MKKKVCSTSILEAVKQAANAVHEWHLDATVPREYPATR